MGASTGGFTDVLLRRGASRVYALDVGRGQLAESLRGDPRVVSMERTHAARLDPDAEDPLRLPEPVSLAVIDVSFISLTRLLLRGVAGAVGPAGRDRGAGQAAVRAVAARGPQGRGARPEDREAAVERVRAHAVGLGLMDLGTVESPLVGPAGNHEFFLHLGVPAGWQP